MKYLTEPETQRISQAKDRGEAEDAGSQIISHRQETVSPEEYERVIPGLRREVGVLLTKLFGADWRLQDFKAAVARLDTEGNSAVEANTAIADALETLLSASLAKEDDPLVQVIGTDVARLTGMVDRSPQEFDAVSVPLLRRILDSFRTLLLAEAYDPRNEARFDILDREFNFAESQLSGLALNYEQRVGGVDQAYADEVTATALAAIGDLYAYFEAEQAEGEPNDLPADRHLTPR